MLCMDLIFRLIKILYIYIYMIYVYRPYLPTSKDSIYLYIYVVFVSKFLLKNRIYISEYGIHIYIYIYVHIWFHVKVMAFNYSYRGAKSY